mmetsp:Transcript_39337/g.92748  ORF Transcript_39337/g.92748 Transcript_39337/m.92748 type:complete len:200 (+) Transcript_39337:138-737(+)
MMVEAEDCNDSRVLRHEKIRPRTHLMKHPHFSTVGEIFLGSAPISSMCPWSASSRTTASSSDSNSKILLNRKTFSISFALCAESLQYLLAALGASSYIDIPARSARTTQPRGEVSSRMKASRSSRCCVASSLHISACIAASCRLDSASSTTVNDASRSLISEMETIDAVEDDRETWIDCAASLLTSSSAKWPETIATYA